MRFSLVLSALVLTGFAGCGSQKGPSYGSDEGRKIAIIIDSLADDVSNTKTFQGHFASGSLPKSAEMKVFAKCQFEIVGSPSISGDTATTKVAVRDTTNSKDVGEFEWTFVKEGNSWKIKSAPVR